MIPSAPTPEVQYLPTIFRRIQSGDIQIPAFQREFIWSEAQVLELLRSIYQGFPIGSVLFWRVEAKVFKIATSESTAFPEVPEGYPLSYVIDGLQRLSTLYGCFHWQKQDTPSKFNVIFDLDKEEFAHFEGGKMPEDYIHLSSIFSPKMFLEAQSRLMHSDKSDQLINKAINLHTTFQEYLVPTVTISGRGIEEVVSIFERINSTGTRLGAVDFLRAVTWAEEFDLSDELESISNLARVEGYEIPFDTLTKVLAISLDIPPTAETMVQLRNYPPNKLHWAVEQAKQSLSKVIRFLKEEYQVLSYDYIPYEGQLLALVKYAQVSGQLFNQYIKEIMHWYWTISFNEGLRGKPDNYVARLLETVVWLVSGNADALKGRLTILPEDFVERRFIQGKALSSAIANLFVFSGARSFFTGEHINPEEFMSEFSANNYEGLLNLPEIPSFGRGRAQSSKVIANIVLVTATERRRLRTMSAKALVEDVKHRFGKDADDIFASQMLTPDGIKHIEEGDSFGFLISRAFVIWGKVLELTGSDSRQQ